MELCFGGAPTPATCSGPPGGCGPRCVPERRAHARPPSGTPRMPPFHLGRRRRWCPMRDPTEATTLRAGPSQLRNGCRSTDGLADPPVGPAQGLMPLGQQDEVHSVSGVRAGVPLRVAAAMPMVVAMGRVLRGPIRVPTRCPNLWVVALPPPPEQSLGTHAQRGVYGLSTASSVCC